MKTRVAVLLFLALAVLGQNRPSDHEPPKRLFARRGTPSILHAQVGALGHRVKGASGKEKTSFAGTLVDSRGATLPATLIHQLPDLVRIDGMKPGAVAFDGEMSRAAQPLSAEDEGVLESLVTDTPEGLFAAADESGGLHLFGRGFKPDPAVFRNYAGPSYDIYELHSPVKTRADRTARTKRYYFDGDTGLLLSVRYKDSSRSPFPSVETRFSGWSKIDGSAYPGKIERLEDGKVVMSFAVHHVTYGPAQEIGVFKP